MQNYKLKLLIAIAIAGLLWWYAGWTWLLIFPLAVFLFGSNGSRWMKIPYQPRDGDQGVTLFYNQEGEHYRNSKGETYQMVERGKDTWASPDNWKGGQR